MVRGFDGEGSGPGIPKRPHDDPQQTGDAVAGAFFFFFLGLFASFRRGSGSICSVDCGVLLVV